MDQQRLKQIEDLYHGALQHSPDDRFTWLATACRDDAELFHEVESLLLHHERGDGLLQKPLADVAADLVTASAPLVLSPGKRLGEYEILEIAGAGGMAQVYRAKDTRLERTVAIKVISPDVIHHHHGRERFEREARVISRLNHPNICTLHDVGQQDGIDFLVMEYLEGETLAHRLSRGPLTIDEVLRYGVQIAEAVSHAHDHGVVHRDLKPGNTFVTPQGRIKVLDFGLAKRSSAQDVAEATTGSQTAAGMVLGTLAYMSPEQLRGAAADSRSDVWSLGVMLYEMVSGARPFQGNTAFELSSAILSHTPKPLPEKVPLQLKMVIGRCLEKEPERRYQRASEIHSALQAIHAGAPSPKAPLLRLDRRRALALLAACIVIAAVIVGLWTLRGRQSPNPTMKSIVVLPLENLSGDPAQAYFVEGMYDAIIGELAQISALTVIPRSTVMRYKPATKSLSEIARDLSVDAIVAASVSRAGENVRIRVELIGTRPERSLWTQPFERELRDVLALHSEIARAIAVQVQVRLTPKEASRLEKVRTVKPAAYDAWLKAAQHQTRLTGPDLTACVRSAKDAVAIDPTYAPAFVVMAQCYNNLTFFTNAAPETMYALGKAAASQALALDQDLAVAHTALAGSQGMGDWDWESAERSYKRALELDDRLSNVHSTYGFFLSWLGRFDDAVYHAQLAQSLEPVSVVRSQNLAQVLNLARRYDEAIKEAQRVIDLDPRYLFGHIRLLLAYTWKGLYKEAIVAGEKAVAVAGPDDPRTKAFLGAAYGLGGRRAEAVKILEELLAKEKQTYVQPTGIAAIYLSLGNKDETLHWLERAYELHDADMVTVKVRPTWDPLRADPRFQTLVRKMRFPD